MSFEYKTEEEAAAIMAEIVRLDVQLTPLAQ
jgi:hypothetical protein